MFDLLQFVCPVFDGVGMCGERIIFHDFFPRRINAGLLEAAGKVVGFFLRFIDDGLAEADGRFGGVGASRHFAFPERGGRGGGAEADDECGEKKCFHDIGLQMAAISLRTPCKVASVWAPGSAKAFSASTEILETQD